MKHYFLLIVVAILFISCSDDSFESNSKKFKITDVFPKKAKIGDTITITGNNLMSEERILLHHLNKDYSKYNVYVYRFNYIEGSNEEIKIVVPTLVHEDIAIGFGIDSPKFKLSGFFSIGALPNVAGAGTSAVNVQLMSESIAFKNNGNKLYKSTDGFYNWTLVTEFTEGSIYSFYYLNQNQCWIGVNKDDDSHAIYYSENGGKNFNFKFKVSGKYDGGWIEKIQFISDTKGLFIDDDNDIFITDNNTFKNIYDYYPELINLTSGKIQWADFNIINENLLFISPNSGKYLIKIENGNVSKYSFDIWPGVPQFFNNTGYLQVNSDIYKSTDLGTSWTKIKTFEGHYPRIYFFNEKEGLAFVNYKPEIVFKTIDGGVTWKEYFTIPKGHGGFRKDFYNKTGLLRSGNRGRLFKFLEDSNFYN